MKEQAEKRTNSIALGPELEIRVVSLEDLIVDRLCAAKYWDDTDSLMWAKVLLEILENGRSGHGYLTKRAEKENCGPFIAPLPKKRRRVMRLDYDKLQNIACEARAELIRAAGSIGRRRIRRKRRDAEKPALLYRMALDRLEKYPPCRDEKGRLVLPYFTVRQTDP